VAANAAQKRKEQDRKTPAIEPKDQRVGVAKVTKGVTEGQTPAKLDLWNRAKMVAESKFHGANKHAMLFATKWYQQHGGTWKS